MPDYRVNHDYQAGALGPFKKGQTVDLTEAQAEWVNRDSDGTLSPAKPEAKPEKAPAVKKQAPKAKPEPEAHSTENTPGLTK